MKVSNRMKPFLICATLMGAVALLPTQAHAEHSNENPNGVGHQGQGGTSTTYNQGAKALAGSLSLSGAVAGAGAIGNAGDTTSTNTTSLNIDNRNKRNAPAVFAAPIPTTRGSCRLYMFGGGSSPDGAVTGSIPLGNDQTCITVVAVGLMQASGSFTQLEVDTMICKIEGMDELPTCKDLKQ